MTLKFYQLLSLFFLLSVFDASAGADKLVVIVNSQNDIAEISEQEFKRIFLKKRKIWLSGSQKDHVIEVVYQPYSRNITAEFSEKLLGLNLNGLKKYWADERYKGGELHPTVVHNTSAMIDHVSKTPTAIGFVVNAENLIKNSKVRVVGEFKIPLDIAEKKSRLLLTSLNYLPDFPKELKIQVVGDDDISDALNCLSSEKFEKFSIKSVNTGELQNLTEKPDIIFIGKNANISLVVDYAKAKKVLTVTDSAKIFSLGTNLCLNQNEKKWHLQWTELNGFRWDSRMAIWAEELK